MNADRREILQLLRASLFLCATPSLTSVPSFARARGRPSVALLLPLTGPSAEIGRGLQRAAELVQSVRDDLMPLDTGGTPAGATAAASQAIRRGARLILGPLFAREVRAVMNVAAGRLPVISFSNDMSLRGSGAFLLGISPSQMTSAILRYARGRGIRRFVMPEGQSEWARQSFAAARRLVGELGIELIGFGTTGVPSLLNAMRTAAGSELPDALLMTEGGAALLSVASALRGSGVQLLGAMQGLDHRLPALTAIDGAWLAAPNPMALGHFAQDYESRHGSAPGAIAALAFDAAGIAAALAASGSFDHKALLATAGFAGIAGAVRFRTDGSCTRELAILVPSQRGYEMVASVAAA